MHFIVLCKYNNLSMALSLHKLQQTMMAAQDENTFDDKSTLA